MTSSQNWISKSSKNGRIKINQDATRVFSTVGDKPCNLISIFGLARQGKSFLMNCLSGNDSTFAVSSRMDPCTQGIDISESSVDLHAFSTIDGGNQVSGDAVVGFVDAEGQGDRDIGYDAKLVCPILLASKCVIYNYKGDLQKNNLLETLGIMLRAARNVGSDPSIQGEHKKFSHLHIVFRDWRAAEEGDKGKMLAFGKIFDMEGTRLAANRDAIRRDIQETFSSVSVWMLDPPANAQQLRGKLTLQKTSRIFREQLRELRNALSEQLKEPLKFAGRSLTGKTMAPFMKSIVDTLNAGESVIPESSFVSMIGDELNQLRIQLDIQMNEAAHTQQARLMAYSGAASFPAQFSKGELVLYSSPSVEEELVTVTAVHLDDAPNVYYTIFLPKSGKERQTDASCLRSNVADGTTFILSEAESCGAFSRQLDDLLAAFEVDKAAVLGDLQGHLARRMTEDAAAEVARTRHNLESRFLTAYQVQFDNWLRGARQRAEALIVQKVKSLVSRDSGLAVGSLDISLSLLWDEVAESIMGVRHYSDNKATKAAFLDAVAQLRLLWAQEGDKKKRDHLERSVFLPRRQSSKSFGDSKDAKDAEKKPTLFRGTGITILGGAAQSSSGNGERSRSDEGNHDDGDGEGDDDHCSSGGSADRVTFKRPKKSPAGKVGLRQQQQDTEMQEKVDAAVDDMKAALRDTAASLSYSFKTGFSLRLLESELNTIYEQRLDSLLSDVRGSATEREVVSMFEKACIGLRQELLTVYKHSCDAAVGSAKQVAISSIEDYSLEEEDDDFEAVQQPPEQKLQDMLERALASVSEWDLNSFELEMLLKKPIGVAIQQRLAQLRQGAGAGEVIGAAAAGVGPASIGSWTFSGFGSDGGVFGFFGSFFGKWLGKTESGPVSAPTIDAASLPSAHARVPVSIPFTEQTTIPASSARSPSAALRQSVGGPFGGIPSTGGNPSKIIQATPSKKTPADGPFSPTAVAASPARQVPRASSVAEQLLEAKKLRDTYSPAPVKSRASLGGQRRTSTSTAVKATAVAPAAQPTVPASSPQPRGPAIKAELSLNPASPSPTRPVAIRTDPVTAAKQQQMMEMERRKREAIERIRSPEASAAKRKR